MWNRTDSHQHVLLAEKRMLTQNNIQSRGRGGCDLTIDGCVESSRKKFFIFCVTCARARDIERKYVEKVAQDDFTGHRVAKTYI